MAYGVVHWTITLFKHVGGSQKLKYLANISCKISDYNFKYSFVKIEKFKCLNSQIFNNDISFFFLRRVLYLFQTLLISNALSLFKSSNIFFFSEK